MDSEKLLELLGIKRQENLDSVNTAQIMLGNQHAYDGLKSQQRINTAAQNAFWRSKCGEAYEAPEDDVGSNFINCSITSDAAVKQLAALVNDGTPAPDPPVVRPAPWWRWLFGTILAIGLGALLVWLTLNWFQNPAGDQYEIIAIPFDPNR